MSRQKVWVFESPFCMNSGTFSSPDYLEQLIYEMMKKDLVVFIDLVNLQKETWPILQGPFFHSFVSVFRI